MGYPLQLCPTRKSSYFIPQWFRFTTRPGQTIQGIKRSDYPYTEYDKLGNAFGFLSVLECFPVRLCWGYPSNRDIVSAPNQPSNRKGLIAITVYAQVVARLVSLPLWKLSHVLESTECKNRVGCNTVVIKTWTTHSPQAVIPTNEWCLRGRTVLCSVVRLYVHHELGQRMANQSIIAICTMLYLVAILALYRYSIHEVCIKISG